MKITKVSSTRVQLLLTLQPENEAEIALLTLASGAYGSIAAPIETITDRDNPEKEGTSESVITLALRN